MPADPEAAWEPGTAPASRSSGRPLHAAARASGARRRVARRPQALEDAGALRFGPLAGCRPRSRTARRARATSASYRDRAPTTLEQVIASPPSARKGSGRRGVTAAAARDAAPAAGARHGRAHGDGERLASDLVVDATGRGSTFPQAARRGWGGTGRGGAPRTAASCTTRASSAASTPPCAARSTARSGRSRS